jgi:hypothetical protein
MSRRGRKLSLAGLLIGLPLLAVPAFAEEPCDEWFPDFRCGCSGRFEGFEKPIVAPYLFEDPFVTTRAVPYFALSDRVALSATKDGYVWNRNGNPLPEDSQGFLNIGAGVKVALWQDRDAGRIVSGILRIELPTGSSDQYQGHGDGTAVPLLAGALRTGPLRSRAPTS